MRYGATRAQDNGPIVLVGLAMAVLSTLVAVSGLTIPLPDVVYRAATALGGAVAAVDPFGDEAHLRTTPLGGRVVLTPEERAALRAERRRALAEAARTREGAGRRHGNGARRAPERGAGATVTASRHTAPARPATAHGASTVRPKRPAVVGPDHRTRREVDEVDGKPRKTRAARGHASTNESAASPPPSPATAPVSPEAPAAYAPLPEPLPQTDVEEPTPVPTAPAAGAEDIPPGRHECRETNGEGDGKAYGLCK